MEPPADLQPWLRLLLTSGIGRTHARRLLAAFGSAETVFTSPPDALAAVVGPRLAAALADEPQGLPAQHEAALSWLAAGPDRLLLRVGDAAYPRALLESPDPPLMLFVRGQVDALAAPSIAVVGSRRPSAQGRENAHAFARKLAEAGCAVVSGLAQGIDAAAHEGALAAGQHTVAVMGTGPDRIYPRRHLELARRIVEQGAVVTEFLPGTPPLAENFPQRNRIIAGLCQGTLVVEAALQSGSLITARLANEAGREVFAIPGSIRSKQSRGCHALIRDGARLVESADEIVEELRQPVLGAAWRRPAAQAVAAVAAGSPSDDILEALGQDPVTLDSLLARTGRSAAELLARLLELELDGWVARLPGGLYQRIGWA